jgi:hypothetical protein
MNPKLSPTSALISTSIPIKSKLACLKSMTRLIKPQPLPFISLQARDFNTMGISIKKLVANTSIDLKV